MLVTVLEVGFPVEGFKVKSLIPDQNEPRDRYQFDPEITKCGSMALYPVVDELDVTRPWSVQ
jgi:hypothetical protein